MEERQKKAAEKGGGDNGDDDDDEEEDTAQSRFVLRLLRFLLKGCLAKDRVVRFRVVQCLSEMIAHLGEIEYVRPVLRIIEVYLT